MKTYKEYLLENFKPRKYRKHLYSSDKTERDLIGLLQDDINNIVYFKNPSLKIQRYVIKHRPDLIKYINNLNPILKKKHAHEIGLSDIEI